MANEETARESAEGTGARAKACDPFGCTKCAAVVFIPRDAGITGGVCTQQTRGCCGKLRALDDVGAARVRRYMAALNVVEQPWLTLVFAPKAPEVQP